MSAAHEIALRVYYEDTDAAGIVYHSNYLKFAERGRTEYLRARGYDHPRLAAEHGVVFAVASCDVAFLRPARLDDLLTVRTRVTAAGGARLEMLQEVLRDGTVCARLAVTLAILHAATLRPMRVPAILQRAFAQALGGESGGSTST